jgi:hypothetical protein
MAIVVGKTTILSCSPKPTGYDLVDELLLLYLRFIRCSPCDILRFKERSGINDLGLLTDNAKAYANLEQATRGYNIYKASPMGSRDQGFADNLVIYNWAVSKQHNYD